MVQPTPFRIDIAQSELDELQARLRRTRWPADPGNPDGRYGATAEWMADLVHHWAEEYDWRAVEARMNAYDHQRVEIDGVPIHFMRVPGTGPSPMPIVLTHGWPWTFWDLRKVADALADPAAHGGDPADSFDVIVPSMPGYGFSVPLQQTGVDIARIAELWVSLMRDVLGYERFAAQGGDWGAFVTGRLGHAHAEHLIGVYLTMPVIPGLLGKRAPRPADFAPDEQWMVARADEARRMTEAHVAVHRRDPQTFAYAMADSPTGLGAWLWHRRDLWCDGDPLEVFGREDLCTLSSLYWFNSSFASSIRIYAEQFTKPQALVHDRERIIDAPTGFGVFAKELMFLPRATAERHTNLQRWTVFDRGGHFAPAERPDAVVDELRAFFRPLR
ncbi:MAG: epoxide hydrolase [Acidimicrobiales bacterium]|nr:epoxide hydrolase [Acidimicrobiales bacterium]